MNALAPDPAMLLRRARDMMRAGRASAARPLLAALQHIAPALPETMELQARLLLGEGRLDDALALLTAALTAHPDDVTLRLSRAEMRLMSGEALGGADDAAAAVIAASDNAPAKAMLGMALIRLERFEEAALCLREAVAAAPIHAGFRAAYAHALDAAGQFAAAHATLCEGILRAPSSVELRIAAIVNAMRRDAPGEAAVLAESARRDGIADARVFELLGHALGQRGDEAGAADAYAEASKLAPEDPYLRYLVAACETVLSDAGSTARASGLFVQRVYDGFAPHYEKHRLTQGTRLPGLIRSAILAHMPDTAAGQSIGPLLNLGCGSGLIGAALSDLPVHGLIGVDLSAGMLAEARLKTVYAELRQEDLAVSLRTATPGAWGLIVAADSLCYVGALATILHDAFNALRPGGVFVFSLDSWQAGTIGPADGGLSGPGAVFDGKLSQAGAPDGPPLSGERSHTVPCWRSAPLGRYVHDARGVAELAAQAGFELRALHHETLRQERGGKVLGMIVVLARPE